MANHTIKLHPPDKAAYCSVGHNAPKPGVQMRFILIITGMFLLCMVSSLPAEEARFPNAIDRDGYRVIIEAHLNV